MTPRSAGSHFRRSLTQITSLVVRVQQTFVCESSTTVKAGVGQEQHCSTWNNSSFMSPEQKNDGKIAVKNRELSEINENSLLYYMPARNR